jgi:hypothetical protein
MSNKPEAQALTDDQPTEETTLSQYVATTGLSSTKLQPSDNVLLGAVDRARSVSSSESATPTTRSTRPEQTLEAQVATATVVASILAGRKRSSSEALSVQSDSRSPTKKLKTDESNNFDDSGYISLCESLKRAKFGEEESAGGDEAATIERHTVYEESSHKERKVDTKEDAIKKETSRVEAIKQLDNTLRRIIPLSMQWGHSDVDATLQSILIILHPIASNGSKFSCLSTAERSRSGWIHSRTVKLFKAISKFPDSKLRDSTQETLQCIVDVIVGAKGHTTHPTIEILEQPRPHLVDEEPTQKTVASCTAGCESQPTPEGSSLPGFIHSMQPESFDHSAIKSEVQRQEISTRSDIQQQRQDEPSLMTLQDLPLPEALSAKITGISKQVGEPAQKMWTAWQPFLEQFQPIDLMTDDHLPGKFEVTKIFTLQKVIHAFISVVDAIWDTVEAIDVELTQDLTNQRPPNDGLLDKLIAQLQKNRKRNLLAKIFKPLHHVQRILDMFLIGPGSLCWSDVKQGLQKILAATDPKYMAMRKYVKIHAEVNSEQIPDIPQKFHPCPYSIEEHKDHIQELAALPAEDYTSHHELDCRSDHDVGDQKDSQHDFLINLGPEESVRGFHDFAIPIDFPKADLKELSLIMTLNQSTPDADKIMETYINNYGALIRLHSCITSEPSQERRIMFRNMHLHILGRILFYIDERQTRKQKMKGQLPNNIYGLGGESHDQIRKSAKSSSDYLNSVHPEVIWFDRDAYIRQKNRPCILINSAEGCPFKDSCRFGHHLKGKPCLQDAEGQVCDFGNGCHFVHSKVAANRKKPKCRFFSRPQHCPNLNDCPNWHQYQVAELSSERRGSTTSATSRSPHTPTLASRTHDSPARGSNRTSLGSSLEERNEHGLTPDEQTFVDRLCHENMAQMTQMYYQSTAFMNSGTQLPQDFMNSWQSPQIPFPPLNNGFIMRNTGEPRGVPTGPRGYSPLHRTPNNADLGHSNGQRARQIGRQLHPHSRQNQQPQQNLIEQNHNGQGRKRPLVPESEHDQDHDYNRGRDLGFQIRGTANNSQQGSRPTKAPRVIR